MRSVLLALMVACAAWAITATPAPADGLPYCIKGCDFAGGAGDCSFSSYQQCLATASGRDATCAPNPYFNAKAFNAKAEIADRSRLSRRRL
jgi:hypothetical protein